MLIGRKTELDKLVRNLREGIHTLVFGATGMGKTALLREAASNLHGETESGHLAVYVDDCRDRRSLLEGALAGLALDRDRRGASKDGSHKVDENRRVQDLRNALVAQSKNRNVCLLLDGLPKLHHRLEHLLELLDQHCTLACAVTARGAAYDLYYWKFDKIEVRNLPTRIAMSWIERELDKIGYGRPLRHRIALEILRLAGGILARSRKRSA